MLDFIEVSQIISIIVVFCFCLCALIFYVLSVLERWLFKEATLKDSFSLGLQDMVDFLLVSVKKTWKSIKEPFTRLW